MAVHSLPRWRSCWKVLTAGPWRVAADAGIVPQLLQLYEDVIRDSSSKADGAADTAKSEPELVLKPTSAPQDVVTADGRGTEPAEQRQMLRPVTSQA